MTLALQGFSGLSSVKYRSLDSVLDFTNAAQQDIIPYQFWVNACRVR